MYKKHVSLKHVVRARYCTSRTARIVSARILDITQVGYCYKPRSCDPILSRRPHYFAVTVADWFRFLSAIALTFSIGRIPPLQFVTASSCRSFLYVTLPLMLFIYVFI